MSHQKNTYTKHHTNHQNPNKQKHGLPIRNLKAFLKSYLKSETGQKTLSRPAAFKEFTEVVGFGKNQRTVSWREYTGDNSIALAMSKAAA